METLAQQIAAVVMVKLGFRRPQEHPDWRVIVKAAQTELDFQIGALRIAVHGQSAATDDDWLAHFAMHWRDDNGTKHW